ncbi:MAG: PQQ-binding-like beta-propeller repeat protein [Bacteroidota bacterium]
MLRLSNTFSFLVSLFFLLSCTDDVRKPQSSGEKYTTWSSYLGSPDRSHYSILSQITKKNSADLRVAWTYSAPDSGQMQMNPIVVDTILYGVTAALRVIALQAETGKEMWRFGDSLKVWHSTSRGVAYWENGKDKRVLYTRGPHLFALNALTGRPIHAFGDSGKIDLRSGLPASAKDKFVISNTPGTIYKDLIIMPLRVSEDIGAAPGDIMAFNIVTGDLAWVFHTIPHPNEPGYETWENKEAYGNESIGAANNWAGMALDDETGILYVPTGSAAPDFYGGLRKGSNLYANSLLALEAKTGKLLWHFQFTHHDLWDRDAPAPPNLITITRNGKRIPAVAQVTKQGYVYLFNRENGRPLFPIEEVPVPASNLKGEKAWKTQPFPVKPNPFARQSKDLTLDDISPYAKNREELKQVFNTLDQRLYAPPSLDPVLLLPGYDGAAEWGGAATDPEDGIIYINANEMAWILQMEENDPVPKGISLGARSYRRYCASCHQENRGGIVASGFQRPLLFFV